MAYKRPGENRTGSSTLINPLVVRCPECGAWAMEDCKGIAGDARLAAVRVAPHPARARLARWVNREACFTFPEQLSQQGIPDDLPQ